MCFHGFGFLLDFPANLNSFKKLILKAIHNTFVNLKYIRKLWHTNAFHEIELHNKTLFFNILKYRFQECVHLGIVHYSELRYNSSTQQYKSCTVIEYSHSLEDTVQSTFTCIRWVVLR